MRNAASYMCKAICFVILGSALLFGIQGILSMKWVYPSFAADTLYKLEEFYQLPEDAGIQAVFLGTSHAEIGISPMAIYERSGIATFNLGSTGQPLEGSCFLLSEILERQHPSLVLFDVSQLFQNGFWETAYRGLLDNVPFSRNKMRLAREYASHYPAEKRMSAFLGAFLPIYQYHSRWSELSAVDFTQSVPQNYYRKGDYSTSRVQPFGTDLEWEWLNRVTEMLHNNVGWTHSVVDGVPSNSEESGTLYEAAVGENARNQLKRLKQMCDERGTELVLMKIPSAGYPQYYDGTWTRLRSEAAKTLADEFGLSFLDLCYDVDLGIDWTRDTPDAGEHLNYTGALKASAYLADYLEQEHGLTGIPCKLYEEDLPTYRAMCDVTELQMTDSLPTYLDKLSRRENITVFLSAEDDMITNLTPESREALRQLGLQTDFNALNYSDAFFAVVENGTVRREASSNRRITAEGVLSNGQSYRISSCGWLVGGAKSKIAIDGTDYSQNHCGINVVVLDNASGQVLDSAAFDTWNFPENQSAIRANWKTEEFLRKYEQYLMIQDAKNGIGA